MPEMIIQNATVVRPDGLQSARDVVVDNGCIRDVVPHGEGPIEADDVVDAEGNYLAPGFVDLHIHGSHTYLCDRGAEDIEAMCALLPQYGVSGYVPTLLPLPEGEDAAYLRSISSLNPGGTRILGFHMEGPFLANPGAIPPEALANATASRAEALIRAAEPRSTVFSISPECDGVIDAIRVMREGNAVVFATHSAAGVEETQAAIEAGVSHATHFLNALPVLGESEPGVRRCGFVEAILADPRVTVDFILDGEHVEPVAVKMAMRCKGPDGVCLITDANIGAGLPPGRFRSFGDAELEIAYEGGPARYTSNHPNLPGGLTGSGLTMDHAVRNAVKWLDVDLCQAVRMASANPARVLGREDSIGRIQEGYNADLVLLDQQLNVMRTWVGGDCVYRREA